MVNQMTTATVSRHTPLNVVEGRSVHLWIIIRPITKSLFIQQSTYPSINKPASILTLPEYVSSCETRPVQPLKLPQGCIVPLTIH
jgi:hypothetical protein